jgi:hypothetical protein
MVPVFEDNGFSDGGLLTSILCGLLKEFWELRGASGFSGCSWGWCWLLDL